MLCVTLVTLRKRQRRAHMERAPGERHTHMLPLTLCTPKLRSGELDTVL